MKRRQSIISRKGYGDQEIATGSNKTSKVGLEVEKEHSCRKHTRFSSKDKPLYQSFADSIKPGVFFRHNDLRPTSLDVTTSRKMVSGTLNKDANSYIERYSAQIMTQKAKSSKNEQMHFMKTKPGRNTDFKAKMLKDYLTPKGKQFRNIDLARVELEENCRHMPVSVERMTLACRQDISHCTTLN